jgi:hypothetical protein
MEKKETQVSMLDKSFEGNEKDGRNENEEKNLVKCVENRGES